jgi:16S rRNA (cytidine1402-2'-O)-methyltransferase
MSGTLFVVATPIGNLEDITLRALRVLRDVPVIAAEDTRRTAKLLAHHGIGTPMLSFHEHNARTRTPVLVARLQRGDDVALVTDAGTPGVSDPGVELVAACVAAGISVDPLPGPSAALVALVGSGFATTHVVFLGFPPAKGNARKRWLEAAAARTETVVFFESPHRVGSAISCISSTSVDRPTAVCRELTKVHQEFIRGTAGDVAQRLGEPRGEFTIVLGPVAAPETAPSAVTSEELQLQFGLLTNDERLTRRQAVVELAKRHGYRPKEVYTMLERAKGGVDDLP